MAIEDIIIEYEKPEDREDHKTELRLKYKSGEISTTVFNNHSDISIRRPNLDEIDIPILAVERFYIEENNILARYRDFNKVDHHDISLGKIADGDMERARDWISFANYRIKN